MSPVPFQSPPPSALATLLLTVQLSMLESPGPVMCNPPPFPGALAVVLLSNVTVVKTRVLPAKELSSIPPPALDDELAVNVVLVTVSIPWSLRIPPPDPLAPSASLSLNVQLLTESSPPALKRPPPPWLASAPLATFAFSVVLLTTMSPVPFQSPPPSALATLLLTIHPSMVESPGPVIWSPPPLPGALAAVLFVMVTSVSIRERPSPELSSIAPPALTAVQLSNTVLEQLSMAPASIKIPPPDPDAPLAIQLVNALFVMSSWPDSI